MLVDLNKNK